MHNKERVVVEFGTHRTYWTSGKSAKREDIPSELV